MRNFADLNRSRESRPANLRSEQTYRHGETSRNLGVKQQQHHKVRTNETNSNINGSAQTSRLQSVSPTSEDGGKILSANSSSKKKSINEKRARDEKKSGHDIELGFAEEAKTKSEVRENLAKNQASIVSQTNLGSSDIEENRAKIELKLGEQVILADVSTMTEHINNSTSTATCPFFSPM